MKFISHPEINERNRNCPEKLLKDHLLEVGTNSANYIDELSIKNKSLLRKCAFITGLSHDFGKYTTFFQDHIRKNKPKDKYSQHAFISSIFGAYLGLRTLDPSETFGSLYIFFAVKNHHANLDYLNADLPKKMTESIEAIDDIKIQEKLKIVQKQIEDLRTNLPLILDEIQSILRKGASYGISEQVDISPFFEGGWFDTVKFLSKESRKFLKEATGSTNLTNYFQFLLIFSSLIDGDKRSAARIQEFERVSGISLSLINNYVNKIDKKPIPSKILEIRKALSKKVDDKIASISLSKRIYTLTAPTGAGKTLAALKAAVKIRDLAEHEDSRKLRIVYSLPFTSIIDQTYDVIRNILSANEKFKENSERFLIKHHHLADFDEHISDETYPLDLAVALTESWDSEVIVTTFVQVFQSIIGNKNRSIKKFHRMANSIIILDEIQSIRVEFWKVLGELIKQMSDELNMYFILMTATQPQIVRGDISLEIGFESFPDTLNRTVLKYYPDPISLDEIIELIISNSNDGKTVLIIRNTIKASIATYKELKKRISDLKYNPKIYYLSTNITPRDRVERVEEIKKSLEKKEIIIVVSTQVIEAGIDLTFNVVIRDIGPIDCIVQAAGRCNRNGEQDKPGIIYIINEKEGEESLSEYPMSSKYVYGKQAMDLSVRSLRKFNRLIYECDFPKLMNIYFDEICKWNMCDQPLGTNKLIESMANLTFDSGDEEKKSFEPAYFSLLADSRPMVDVFVVRSDNDQKVLDWFKENVISEKDPKTKKIKMLEVRSKFRQCIISMDKDLAKKIYAVPLKDENGIYVLERGLADQYYNEETGLERADDVFLTQ